MCHIQLTGDDTFFRILIRQADIIQKVTKSEINKKEILHKINEHTCHT